MRVVRERRQQGSLLIVKTVASAAGSRSRASPSCNALHPAQTFSTTFFNKTADLVEKPAWVDFELLGLYLGFAAALAGLGAPFTRAPWTGDNARCCLVLQGRQVFVMLTMQGGVCGNDC